MRHGALKSKGHGVQSCEDFPRQYGETQEPETDPDPETDPGPATLFADEDAHQIEIQPF